MKQQLNINKSYPKKSLGQNFIQNKDFIFKLSSLIRSDNETNIFEIGPGMGALTDQLIKKKYKNLYLIEKDFLLFQKLEDRFKKDPNIFISNSDALKYNYEVINKNQKSIIVGNLPFNISSQLLINWIINYDWPPFYSKMILMFQKEVAERIIADVNSKDYSRITILSKWKFNIRKVIDVKPNSFFPKPKVHSTVLEFVPKKKIHQIEDPRNLEKITKIFFNQRRKMIKKPINILFKKLNFDYKKFNINPSDRPQNLNVDKYLKIVNEYENSRS